MVKAAGRSRPKKFLGNLAIGRIAERHRGPTGPPRSDHPGGGASRRRRRAPERSQGSGRSGRAAQKELPPLPERPGEGP